MAAADMAQAAFHWMSANFDYIVEEVYCCLAAGEGSGIGLTGASGHKRVGWDLRVVYSFRSVVVVFVVGLEACPFWGDSWVHLDSEVLRQEGTFVGRSSPCADLEAAM